MSSICCCAILHLVQCVDYKAMVGEGFFRLLLKSGRDLMATSYRHKITCTHKE
jgi:hypothetical protein